MKAINKNNIQDILSLTPVQEGILYHYLSTKSRDSENGSFIENLNLEIRGNVEFSLFKKSWEYVIANNEMLRTVFRWEGVENPVQIVLRAVELQLYYDDLTKSDHGKDTEYRKPRTGQRCRELFENGHVPFLVILTKVSENSYRMQIENHHILYDGWSTGIILKEFFHAYNVLTDGKEPELSPKTKYNEFIKKSLGSDFSRSESFWKKYLERDEQNRQNESEGSLPIRRNRKAVRRTDNIIIPLGNRLFMDMESFAAANKITVSAILYFGWGLLLQWYLDKNDILFDTMVSGRTAGIKGIDDIVGLFSVTLPLRIKKIRGESLQDSLTRSYDRLQARSEHGTWISPRMRELFAADRETLFDSVMVVENYPLDRVLMTESGYLKVENFNISGTTVYDVSLIIIPHRQFEINCTYNSEIFDKDSIPTLIEHFALILDKIIHNIGYNESLEWEPFNWKIERKKEDLLEKLIKKIRETDRKTVRIETPANRLERELAEIWSNVLVIEQEKMGRDTNFFELGGHSLTASILAGKIRKQYDIKIPQETLFRFPTIKEFAAFLSDKIGTPGEKNNEDSIPAVEKREYYPLSSGQKRLYVFQKMDPGRTDYNGVAVLQMKGPLDKARLQNTIGKLIRRHEGLRTSFHQVDDRLIQKIHDDASIKIEYYSYSMKEQNNSIRRDDTTEKIDRAVEKTILAFVRPFDLSQVPLMRIGLMEQETGKYLLLADMHHIVTDGISLEILIDEMIRLYEGKKLPDQRIQYKDYAQWQSRGGNRRDLLTQQAYWREIFQKKPEVLSLPLDFQRPPVQSFDGGSIEFEIGQEETLKIKKIIKKYDATLYVLLMSVYYIVLAKYSGQDDVIIGTSVAGRNHPDLHQVVGMFINMVPMRNFPTEEKRFEDFLEEVNGKTRDALENQDYPYEELLRQLNLHGDPTKDPLNIAAFVIHNHRLTGNRNMDNGKIEISPYRYEMKYTNFDLNLSAQEKKNSISMLMQYAIKLFKKTTVRRIVQHYYEVLAQVLEDQKICLRDIKLSHQFSTSKSTALVEDENDFLF
jgi:acyl carrier protein